MSESGTSAPAAPAAPAAAQPATPAPATNQNVVNAPAPASQESISLSDAGRLLARRRQETAREAQGQPTARLNPSPAPAGPPGQLTAPVESKPAAPAAPTDSYDTIAKALGLEQGAAPAVAEGPDAAALAPRDGVYEIDGHRVTAAQIRTAMGQAADYTRKTQELAQQRQQLQQQAEALATVLPHIQPELAKLGQQLQGAAPPDPRMIDTDPQGYLRQFAAYQAATAETTTPRHPRPAAAAGFWQHSINQQVEGVAQPGALRQEIRQFWRDDASRGAVQYDIARWAESKGGYTGRNSGDLSDPRHVEVDDEGDDVRLAWKALGTTAPKPVQTAQVCGITPTTSRRRPGTNEPRTGVRGALMPATRQRTGRARRSNASGSGNGRY